MELNQYFVEIQVTVGVWVQVHAKSKRDAEQLADTMASNNDTGFIDNAVYEINDGNYSCEPIYSEELGDNSFSKGVLTIRQVEKEECDECGRPASECSFGGYEVVEFE